MEPAATTTLPPDPDAWRALRLDGRSYAPDASTRDLEAVEGWCDADGVIDRDALRRSYEAEAQLRLAAGGLTLLAERSEAEQQLSLALEEARLNALGDTRNRLAEKARQATSETSARWASDRHRSCSRPLAPRVAACGTRGLAVRCGCGPRVYWRGCRQWWVCRACRARRLKPLAPRIQESLAARVVDEQRGGRRVGLRLVTLTERHSGDVDADRRHLGESFRRLYKSLHKWVGRHHYALVYEVTPGTDGKGHVHAHVAILWPRWIDYGRIRKLWLAASQGHSSRIDIQGVDGDSRHAARYIAKYLSKGSEQLEPELAGRVIAAFYARRSITASRKFWQPRCGCRKCGEAVTLDPSPEQRTEWRREAFVAGLMSYWTARPPPVSGVPDSSDTTE